MRAEMTGQVEPIVSKVIDGLGVELIELSVRKRDRTTVVEIIADKAGGGITIDEITFINKHVARKIEEGGMFGDDFVVEVASPGLDRALKTEKDFTRAVGRKVRVHCSEKIESKLEHHGVIMEANGEEIVIEVQNQLISIPLNFITKAVQVIG